MRYGTILADPPWDQVGGGPLVHCLKEGFSGGVGASRPMPYPTMTTAKIAALPVKDLAAIDCHLYLWTTSGFLHDAFHVLDSWGFKYSTTLVWAKNPIGAGLGGAYGIATEFILFGRRGKGSLYRVGRNWWNWKRPYNARGKPDHSRKPAEIYELAEMVSPGPRLEMFARGRRLGWEAWGNEVESTVDIATA